MKPQFISIDFFFWICKTNIISLLESRQIAILLLGDKTLNKIGHVAREARYQVD